MKTRLLPALFLSLALAAPASAKISRPELHGRWNLVALSSEGHRMPVPNPLLHLFFEFNEVGLARLYYWREDEIGFCERTSFYWFHEADQVISQRVVWLNPANRSDCGRDPDMRLHVETWTPVQLSNHELQLRVRLGDRDINYIFESVK